MRERMRFGPSNGHRNTAEAHHETIEEQRRGARRADARRVDQALDHEAGQRHWGEVARRSGQTGMRQG